MVAYVRQSTLTNVAQKITSEHSTSLVI